MTHHEQCWLRLHLTPGLGRVGIFRLMQVFGSVQAILEASAEEWIARCRIRPSAARNLPSADCADFCQAARLLDDLRVRIVSFWDDDHYPALLRTIHDPPALLYVRGDFDGPEAFAIVGSRRATPAAQTFTEEIASALASHDIAIVSGLARGIDACAHRGALNAAGRTLAVLGCGIDRIYPPENARLFHAILERGAILSEYPPGTLPLAGHFPARNRIISGLAKGVLVVEATEGSGSLITVDFALQQGREVFAVPGPVYAATSTGTNALIKDGARVVTEAADILDVLWPQKPSRTVRYQQESLAATLDDQALRVYGSLAYEPLHIDELAQKSGLTPMEVSAILLHLELQGGVKQLPGMRYIRSGGP